MPFDIDSMIDAWYSDANDEEEQGIYDALSEITLDSNTLISEGDEDEI